MLDHMILKNLGKQQATHWSYNSFCGILDIAGVPVLTNNCFKRNNRGNTFDTAGNLSDRTLLLAGMVWTDARRVGSDAQSCGEHA
jgi:hypothetical protein